MNELIALIQAIYILVKPHDYFSYLAFVESLHGNCLWQDKELQHNRGLIRLPIIGGIKIDICNPIGSELCEESQSGLPDLELGRRSPLIWPSAFPNNEWQLPLLRRRIKFKELDEEREESPPHAAGSYIWVHPGIANISSIIGDIGAIYETFHRLVSFICKGREDQMRTAFARPPFPAAVGSAGDPFPGDFLIRILSGFVKEVRLFESRELRIQQFPAYDSIARHSAP